MHRVKFGAIGGLFKNFTFYKNRSGGGGGKRREVEDLLFFKLEENQMFNFIICPGT